MAAKRPKMTLTEGMRELKLIQQKMADNTRRITRYASSPKDRKPIMGDETTQKKEVQSLIQSNMDLAKDAVELKRRIDKTNLEVEVEIEGIKAPIHDHLYMFRHVVDNKRATFAACNDSFGQSSSMGRKGADPDIDRFYDEKQVNDQLRKIDEYKSRVISRLEVINATTELVD